MTTWAVAPLASAMFSAIRFMRVWISARLRPTTSKPDMPMATNAKVAGTGTALLTEIASRWVYWAVLGVGLGYPLLLVKRMDQLVQIATGTAFHDEIETMVVMKGCQ